VAASAALGLALGSERAAAEEGPDTRSLGAALTYRLGRNTVDAFTGWNALAHGAAVGATYAMVHEGADAALNRWVQGHPRGWSIAWSAPAVLGGIAVPAALPLALWYTSEPRSNQRIAAAAAGQAAALGLATSALVKAFTGRVGPEATDPADLTARSKAFRFGFLRGGIIEGWPSGHTTTNVAMAAALLATSDSWAVRAGASAFALWVALSVSFGINGEVHWTSDAVAGLLTGAAVGWTVGRSFRRGSGAPVAPPPGSTLRIHSIFPVFSGEF
jgi:membrane-associated phospholipid phosphatase